VADVESIALAARTTNGSRWTAPIGAGAAPRRAQVYGSGAGRLIGGGRFCWGNGPRAALLLPERGWGLLPLFVPSDRAPPGLHIRPRQVWSDRRGL